jgi:uncharacterized protein Yka (UPF0111/DUF47 family)
MTNTIARLLPFASRTRPTNPFVEQFQKITAHAVSANEQLMAALRGAPDSLTRIVEIEHSADDAVRDVQRLVDRTFIPPYDKRDIVKLAHRLDSVVDSMRTAVRLLVSYRALQAKDAKNMAATALDMCELILRSVIRLKKVVDEMPAFDHDGLREAARTIDVVEDECDELFARAIYTVFPDPNQHLTAAMLAWRDIFRLLERTTDQCSHAMSVIISIARQEGS